MRLLWAIFKIGVQSELAYRANFIVRLFQTLLELGTALAGLAVVFSHTETLGGWRPDEIGALLGVYFLIGGVISLVIHPSMQEFVESVRDGGLDMILFKPQDAQLLVSIRKVDVWGLFDMAMGLGVLAVALVRIGSRLEFGQTALFGVLLLAGVAIVYAFWLILATLSFWFVRVENILFIFQGMYEAGRWPVTLYPRWLRYGLTFLVPVAFATTIPAEALTGRLKPEMTALTLALAVMLLVLSRLFWKAGLRRYSGASA